MSFPSFNVQPSVCIDYTLCAVDIEYLTATYLKRNEKSDNRRNICHLRLMSLYGRFEKVAYIWVIEAIEIMLIQPASQSASRFLHASQWFSSRGSSQKMHTLHARTHTPNIKRQPFHAAANSNSLNLIMVKLRLKMWKRVCQVFILIDRPISWQLPHFKSQNRPNRKFFVFIFIFRHYFLFFHFKLIWPFK